MRAGVTFACGALAVGVAGCGGSGQTAASVATPASPIIISALIGSGHVSLSPTRVGAGPVLLTVTNQSARAESLVVMAGSSSHVVARTAPINPQGSTQLNVALRRGRYELAIAAAAPKTDAQRSRQSGAVGTTLRVGAARSGGSSAMLTP